MTKNQIKATGSYLTSYQNDLEYIRQFQNFKKNKISEEDYIDKKTNTFYSFLIEFKIVRNFSKGKVDELLIETKKFINGAKPNDVDLFANILSQSDLTRGKITTSMASKILFLNNPWEILPIDILARKTLNLKENNYSLYKNKLNIYREKNDFAINDCISYTKPLTEIIHKEFENDIDNLHIIAKNRMFDKLLWTLGK